MNIDISLIFRNFQSYNKTEKNDLSKIVKKRKI